MISRGVCLVVLNEALDELRSLDMASSRRTTSTITTSSLDDLFGNILTSHRVFDQSWFQKCVQSYCLTGDVDIRAAYMDVVEQVKYFEQVLSSERVVKSNEEDTGEADEADEAGEVGEVGEAEEMSETTLMSENSVSLRDLEWSGSVVVVDQDVVGVKEESEEEKKMNGDPLPGCSPEEQFKETQARLNLVGRMLRGEVVTERQKKRRQERAERRIQRAEMRIAKFKLKMADNEEQDTS